MPAAPPPPIRAALPDGPGASPVAPAFDASRALGLARSTLEIGAEALLALRERQGEGFAAACRAILGCRGRVVVMGVGKSGLVGRKIAATLASTGTPALSVHPADASHGDIGMIAPGDIVLALSNSGESDEIAALVPALRRLGVPVIAITGRPGSTLARHAAVVVDSAVEREACPLQLAPTTSTTAQMAIGDALAVALLDARGFRAEDFARSHPGGSLGRKLLIHVRDLMRSGAELPRVRPGTAFTEVLREMSAGGLGFAVVADSADQVLGIFTDGDLRRLIERGAELRGLTAADVMHPDPKRIDADALAVDAAGLMEQHRVTSVLVVDPAGRLIGALNTNDLMRAKVI